LSVANCRKEPALLFRLEASGELTFVKKVLPGDVADVPTQAGERWVAVFMEAPHRAQRTAAPAQPTWLLRPEAAVPAPAPTVTTY
jgi:hypothetical protein